MWKNSKIDRLGDQLRSRAFDAELLTGLDEYRASFLPAYTSVVARLRDQLHYTVTGRPAKSTTALVDKLERQHVRLSQVQDIAGCRVVVEDIFLQERALSAMEVYLDAPAVFDRRANPSHGYRAIHLVATIENRKVEIQLRTELQHLWAEISEKISDLVGPSIKYGVGDESQIQLLQNLSIAVERVETEESARRDFMLRVQREGLTVNKKIKKDIRSFEKRFFQRRNQLIQLLLDVRDNHLAEAA